MPVKSGAKRRSLPRNVVRIHHPGPADARVPVRYGVTVKIFGKQTRLGSRFTDIKSAQRVALAFHRVVVKVRDRPLKK